MDVNYLRLALVIVIGAALYYAAMVQYNTGAANVIVLGYALVIIPVYQMLGSIQKTITGSAA